MMAEGRSSSISSPGYPLQTQGPPSILPPEKVFPIQIGSDLFRLSGASIASDAPSYFSRFFEEQVRQNGEGATVRTLYIDRDPDTFRDILKHLQGYYIRPRDNSHFVKLFADAQFYSLPRLISQLFESEIFIQIGDRHFEIPRDIFSSPGNSPNFFSLGFAVFFATPGEVFPGLDRQGLLRPPAITPPIVSNRSGDVFAELLHFLRGYPVQVRSEEHREELLRDCRYFHLRGLEQRLIPHDISYNPDRQRSEITVRLEDIRPSGLQVILDPIASQLPGWSGGWVQYARPFVDDEHHELIIETAGETARIDSVSRRIDFYGSAKPKITNLLQIISNKANVLANTSPSLPGELKGDQSGRTTPGSGPSNSNPIRVVIDSESDVVLDGEPYAAATDATSRIGASEGADPWMTGITGLPADNDWLGSIGNTFQSSMLERQTPLPTSMPPGPPPRKRKRSDSVDHYREWVVRRGHWRLQVTFSSNGSSGVEVVFTALKLDAYTRQRYRNERRQFLDR